LDCQVVVRQAWHYDRQDGLDRVRAAKRRVVEVRVDHRVENPETVTDTVKILAEVREGLDGTGEDAPLVMEA